MKARHHFWLVYQVRGAFRRQLIAAETAAPPSGWPVKLFRPRKLLRLPLVFHSYELPAVISAVTLTLRTPFLLES